jgi:hypothetical protein
MLATYVVPQAPPRAGQVPSSALAPVLTPGAWSLPCSRMLYMGHCSGQVPSWTPDTQQPKEWRLHYVCLWRRKGLGGLLWSQAEAVKQDLHRACPTPKRVCSLSE